MPDSIPPVPPAPAVLHVRYTHGAVTATKTTPSQMIWIATCSCSNCDFGQRLMHESRAELKQLVSLLQDEHNLDPQLQLDFDTSEGVDTLIALDTRRLKLWRAVCPDDAEHHAEIVLRAWSMEVRLKLAALLKQRLAQKDTEGADACVDALSVLGEWLHSGGHPAPLEPEDDDNTDDSARDAGENAAAPEPQA